MPSIAPPLVLYHDDCNDGLAAAWAARRAMPDAECVPVQHGDLVPEVRGRAVFLLDFAYPRPVMQEILDACVSLVVLDHHDTAEKALRGMQHANLHRAVFDMERSGAGLAWDELVNGRALYPKERRPRPRLVDLIEDGDLGRFRFPETKAIVEAVRARPRTMDEFEQLVAMTESQFGFEALKYAGQSIYQAKMQMVEQMMHFAQDVELPAVGERVWAVNVPYLLGSEAATALIRDRRVGLTYWWDGRRGKYRFSVRSKDGHSAAEVALAHGGGGHPDAAAFTAAKLPWTVTA